LDEERQQSSRGGFVITDSNSLNSVNRAAGPQRRRQTDRATIATYMGCVDSL